MIAEKARRSLATAEEIEDALSYRRYMVVKEIRLLNTLPYPVCPRCDLSLDREYMSFCNNCGQRLNWANYRKAKVR